MAKKKKRKEEEKTPKKYSVELFGLFLIIVALIGFIPKTGVIGNFISSFSSFLVGIWYGLFLVALIVVGVYMIIKREKPDFFTSKLVGLYVFILGLLILTHTKYIKDINLKGMDIISETLNQFMASISSGKSQLGGGIVGAVFSCIFVSLFDTTGTTIVTWALLVCGIVMFTGMSIMDILKKGVSKVKIKKPEKKQKSEVREIHDLKELEEIDEVSDKRTIVTSIDEIINISNNEKEMPIKSEVNDISNENVIENDKVKETKGYILPPNNLLSKPKNKQSESKETISNNVSILEKVLKDFGITGKVVAINPGPTVTQYEVEAASGTKMSKVLSIHREIALALAAKDIRIEAPIPGKSTIGIEIPNKQTETVCVREILESIPPKYKNSKLLAVLGKDIMGRARYFEINKTPHMLVAGSTGSGKSVCINSIIVSILMKAKPDEVKLVLVDPKKVEFSMYNGIPHLLTPVVTDPKRANIALKKIVVEMENRYEKFSESGTKNIEGYNEYVERENKNRDSNNKIRKFPFIVVIIDELADLMLVAAKEVEDSIMRITQMARAAGIHLIVATQRPSTDVITGVVKSNIPCRVSFAVSSSVDSRTILDMIGAEKLLGKGDMLFKPQDENIPTRIQGTFITDEEIKKVVDYTINQQKAHYDETFIMSDEEMHSTTMVSDESSSSNEKDATEEPLYNEIVEFVVTQGKASASLLQRRFRLGYNRAARAIDLLEERGIIGPSQGSKPREVLIKLESKEED